VYLLIVVPIFTYRNRENFEKLLNFIKNSSISRNEFERGVDRIVYAKWNDPEREVIFWIKTILVLCFVFMGLIIPDVMFFSSRETPFRDVMHHFVGLPFTDRIPTLNIFCVLFVFEIVLTIFPLTIIVCEAALIIRIATELNNIVFDYCRRMQNLCETFVEHMEEKFEISSSVWNSQVEFSLLSIFEEKLRIFIQEYVECMR